jgi:hypothetical protein
VILQEPQYPDVQARSVCRDQGIKREEEGKDFCRNLGEHMRKRGGTFQWSYAPEIEQPMNTVYESLSEKDRRIYAAIEAHKLPRGGIT